MSPKATSTKDHTRQLLLKTGLEMILERGYTATSVNDVLTAVGVPKGSFYYYFKSKEDFCANILLYYQQEKQSLQNACFGDENLSPLNRLRMILVHGIRHLQQSDYQSGCLIGTLGQEISAHSPQLRTILDTMVDSWMASHRNCFEQAQQAGELPLELTPEELNTMVECYGLMLQGAILNARITKTLHSFHSFHWLFFQNIGKPMHRLSDDVEALLTSNGVPSIV